MPPNVENIHHIIIYTCNRDYNGYPFIKPDACYNDYSSTLKDQYCQTISLT